MASYLVIETQYTDDMGYVELNITFEFDYLIVISRDPPCDIHFR